MTQKEQVLSMLKAAGSWGLRSDVFLEHRIPRAAARVGELRREGYHIPSEREKQFVRYVLVSEPPRADAGSGAGVPLPAGKEGPRSRASHCRATAAQPHRASAASGEPPQPSCQAPGEAPPALFELPTERPSVPSAYDPYSEAA